MKILKIYILVVLAFAIISCSNDDSLEGGETIPVIESITASKDTIDFGGDFTEIVCVATGGELVYTWDVDLGDIFPTEKEGVVRYSGASCCVGLKEIKCTVKNSMGEAHALVEVFILEPEL